MNPRALIFILLTASCGDGKCREVPVASIPSVQPSSSVVPIQDREKVIREIGPIGTYTPAPKINLDPSRSAPRFQIETVRTSCPICYGFGGTVMAITPSRKSAENHALALRSLMVYYNGEEWNRHVAIVPWFGDHQFALIFADTYTDQANEMCVWIDRLGWATRYESGLPGRRACEVYRSWPPEKP